ncbi:MAG: BlaI/MecI/CopY family transcriptional regulator [Lachnospiraceae bacterium]|nr:BlaI/MecI/CopY family transcriptional regulator [Lachnospiraceae bacterium]
MKKNDTLTAREEEILGYLWDWNEPLTQNEMAERLADQGWNNVTLYKTVQSLSTKGFLEVVGLEKSTKTYARKLVPSLSKEEYYTSILMKNGLSTDSLANLTAAFIGVSKKSESEKKEAVIAKLEEIIASIRDGQDD